MIKWVGGMSCLLFLIVPLPAVSADYYIGAAYGEADVDASGYSNSKTYKAFGGARFGSYGIEAGYINMESFDSWSLNRSVNGIELSSVSYRDIKNVTLVGKLGMLAWNIDDSARTSCSCDGVSPQLGLGLSYRPGAVPLAIRGEVQQFLDVDGADIYLVSAGVQFEF